jgi:ATP-dependent Clp protease protease subunit
MSDLVVAQLLFLDHEGESAITLYVNSPGGEISAGLAIHDTMKMIKSSVNTVCLGQACSMGSFLLAAGDHRLALVNSEIMIHQPIGGAKGQASDIKITADWIIKTKERLNKLLAEYTKQPYEKICADTERDNWMTPEDAKAYGIIDDILIPKQKHNPK